MTVGDMRAITTSGPVLIIGAGLLGTSLGVCLHRAGVSVFLSDISPTAERLAADLGAGEVASSYEELHPTLIIVATPPDVAGTIVIDALGRFPDAVVTDVASVKVPIMDSVLTAAAHSGGEALSRRYVGSHPMAGRERSGAGAADSDLFASRPWVIVGHQDAAASSIRAVRDLAVDVGSIPIEMDADAHDQSVALVSHVPQLLSSLLAARLVHAPTSALGLAGQGLRDTTRIAASDPRLWTTILSENAGPVVKVLEHIESDIHNLVTHLKVATEYCPNEGGSVAALHRVIVEGNRGVARIPGKHGGAPRRYSEVEVLIPDRPGQLGRLFSDLGEAGINIEDLLLEHSAGHKAGVARLMLEPVVALGAEQELEKRGWRIISGSHIDVLETSGK